MAELKLVIQGAPVTKKNNGRIVCAKGVYHILPSKAYMEYMEKAVEQLRPQYKDKGYRPIDIPVNVKAVYYVGTRRKVDISNLTNALHDILQDAEVIKDDCRDVIACTDGSRVYWDRDNPRTEITITPYTEEGGYYNFAEAVARERKAPNYELSKSLIEMGVLMQDEDTELEVELD